MNLVKKLACAAGIAFSMTGAAQAQIVNNWFFNPQGTGIATATPINEYLDVVGSAFINITPGAGGTFTFTESAVFTIPSHDGFGFFPQPPAGNQITATFSAFGAGTFSGGFTFLGGTIEVWADPVVASLFGTTVGFYGANQGTLIGTFNVLAGGGGLVDANGSPINNGQITVHAQADPGDLTTGYWFDPSGTDFNGLGTLAFAFTNANTTGDPSDTLVSELVCQFAAFPGAFCPSGAGYTNVPGDYFVVGNNGQFKLAEIPEPGSIALVGLGLIAAGALRVRGKAASA